MNDFAHIRLVFTFSSMKLTVDRCLKRPGLIIRAKTYYLELNPKGLYIVALGNAAMMPVARNPISQAVGDAAYKHFDEKFETQIAENEQKIQLGQMEDLVSEKHSYFLRKDEVQEFKVEIFHDSVCVKIKGGKAKITLYAHPHYKDVITEMARALNKL